MEKFYFYYALNGGDEERRPMEIEADDWAEAESKAAAILRYETSGIPDEIRKAIKLKSIEYCDENKGHYVKTGVSYI